MAIFNRRQQICNLDVLNITLLIGDAITVIIIFLIA